MLDARSLRFSLAVRGDEQDTEMIPATVIGSTVGLIVGAIIGSHVQADFRRQFTEDLERVRENQPALEPEEQVHADP